MKNPFKGHGKAIARWLAVLIVVAQFIRPARTNPPIDQADTLEASVPVPGDVDAILKRSCGDCHSNSTRWPWYSNVAPMSWLVIRDVRDGRSHMNFSAWPASQSQKSQVTLLSHICREVTSGDMPLWFYLPLHPDARLSKADVKALCDWTVAARQHLGQPPTETSH
jgi:Haem-binding domain